MAEIEIAGVMRSGAYSPNNIGNDAAIINTVSEHLRKRGCSVTLYSEEQFRNSDITQDIILNMCREPASVAKLQSLEDKGRLVINSGYGISNSRREPLTRLLIANGIPYPQSLIVNTNEDVRAELDEAGIGACWIKRGDFHAMHKEDISYCRNAREAQDMLHEYFYRGIRRAVINRHLTGDLVKFYGVQGEPFFYWFYPFDEGHSKYGWETVNGKSQGYAFDIPALHQLCERTSRLLDVKIYGGDCIVGSDGTVRIIDFNDWPSFAPCRDEAAAAIARCILKNIRKHLKTIRHNGK